MRWPSRHSWAWSPSSTPGPGLHLRRKPARLRPLLRPEGRGDERPYPNCWSLPPSAQGQCQAGRGVRRHEAAPLAGARWSTTRACCCWTSHHRPGPAGPPPDVGRACNCCCNKAKSILLTTHFMDEAERLCSRLLVLDHGRRSPKLPARTDLPSTWSPMWWKCFGVGAVQLAEDAACAPGRPRGDQRQRPCFLHPERAAAAAGAWPAGHLRTLHRPAEPGRPVPQAHGADPGVSDESGQMATASPAFNSSD